MRMPQTHAPAKFSVIVFILMCFRPSTLIRIYMRFRFQVDAFAMKTFCVLVRTEGLNTSKCMRFQTKTHWCEEGLSLLEFFILLF